MNLLIGYFDIIKPLLFVNMNILFCRKRIKQHFLPVFLVGIYSKNVVFTYI